MNMEQPRYTPKEEKDITEERKRSVLELIKNGAEYDVPAGADKPRLQLEKFQVENQRLIMQLEKGDKTLPIETVSEKMHRDDEFPEYVEVELNDLKMKIYAIPGEVTKDENGYVTSNIYMGTELEGGKLVMWNVLSLEDKKKVIGKLYNKPF